MPRLTIILALSICSVGSLAKPGALAIGYLELANDSRYEERSAYARIQLRSQSRPLPGAQLGVAEGNRVGRFAGLELTLDHYRGEDLKDLLTRLRKWSKEDDIHFVLLDLPAELIVGLAAESRGLPLLLFNVSAPEDQLRGRRCQPHLLHTLPSHAMWADALTQYLVAKGWRKLLALQGPNRTDTQMIAALQRSAERFGAEVVKTRSFEFGNDPRRRERNNIPLLTAGDAYDVLVVADNEGEFGRYVPYQVKLPRPVVGTTGLVPRAWTWVWERHGAPQLNERFQARAGRKMGATDWAAWVAVKAVVESALRDSSGNYPALADFLRGEELNLDGAKGPALSFRPWNNQLRQPILLATHNAVIGRAPFEGFLHPRNRLDSLGDDADESPCDFTSSQTSMDVGGKR